jgi:hypothetical protein
MQLIFKPMRHLHMILARYWNFRLRRAMRAGGVALVMVFALAAADDKSKPDAATTRALAAELHAAVAEERLASIVLQQASERQKLASERSVSAFRASCEAVGIALDQCQVTPTWGVERKPEPPKAPAK